MTYTGQISLYPSWFTLVFKNFTLSVIWSHYVTVKTATLVTIMNMLTLAWSWTPLEKAAVWQGEPGLRFLKIIENSMVVGSRIDQSNQGRWSPATREPIEYDHW